MILSGQPGQPAIKMTPVNAKMFESVGYVTSTRKLYIQFRGQPAMCFEGVPGFRYSGLLAAPRKDAYYETYIKNQFLSKQLP